MHWAECRGNASGSARLTGGQDAPGRLGIPEWPPATPGQPRKRGERGRENPYALCCSQSTTKPGNKLSGQNGWHLTRNVSVQVSGVAGKPELNIS